MPPLITLLSDFGYQDTYVGVMKAVLFQRCPAAQLIDLTHAVGPQDLAAARFHLLTAYRYFPPETVHLAVIDPGVGSLRRSVAIQFDHGYLVGPDNGIFSGILQESPPSTAVELSNPDYWITPTPSQTFHGRDIFAPAAAHLAAGGHLDDLGNRLDLMSLTNLPIPEPVRSDFSIAGIIQHVDHFGNLISTIPGIWLTDSPWHAAIDNHVISGVNTYTDVATGELAACVGSHGWIEIAVNGSSAWERLRIRVGDSITVSLWNDPQLGA